MTATSPRLSPTDPTEQRIRAFEQRYGRQAKELAAYAAFPLTLTTDVVYCLRETFLPDCPWYTSADLLLSGLCTVVGYDLYEMDVATRRYLLHQLRDRIGEPGIEKVERFMVAYLRHRLKVEDSDRPLVLGEKPHWTALSCLRPGEAYEEIRQALQELAQTAPDSQKRFRLAALVESYGDFLADRGYQPMLIEWADRVAEGEPIDATAELAGQLQSAGFSVSWVEFEVATVAFGVEETPLVESELIQVKFKTVTVNDRGEEVATPSHQAAYFEEPVGDGVLPLRLVAIPSGEFEMGSGEDEPGRYDAESPQHSVKVAPFFISQHPVTQAQWRAVATLPRQTQDLEPAPAHFQGDERPVEQVSWDDAMEFCARLSEVTGRVYRLPTEAEWEYACRADTTTPFYFGETIPTDLANYNGSVFRNEPKGQSRGETTPVGQFPPNAFGLYDMYGNVWEWCLDHWHGSYAGAPTDGTAWLTEDEKARRLIRGGSWNDLPRNCRSAFRINHSPGFRSNYVGFRVVCEAE